MPAESWVIVVRSGPNDPDSGEMLELVLAGATLELDLAVVFADAGNGHLRPDAFAPWRQLLDFDLAAVHSTGSRGEAILPGGVSDLSRAAFECVCRRAQGVVTL